MSKLETSSIIILMCKVGVLRLNAIEPRVQFICRFRDRPISNSHFSGRQLTNLDFGRKNLASNERQ